MEIPKVLLEVVFTGETILTLASTPSLRAVIPVWGGVMDGFDVPLEVSLASENALAAGF